MSWSLASTGAHIDIPRRATQSVSHPLCCSSANGQAYQPGSRSRLTLSNEDPGEGAATAQDESYRIPADIASRRPKAICCHHRCQWLRGIFRNPELAVRDGSGAMGHEPCQRLEGLMMSVSSPL